MSAKKLGLLDEIAAASMSHRKGPLCTVARIMAEMSEIDATDLDTAFKDPKYSNKSIFMVLRGRGYDVAQTTVARHRRGECACGTHG